MIMADRQRPDYGGEQPGKGICVWVINCRQALGLSALQHMLLRCGAASIYGNIKQRRAEKRCSCVAVRAVHLLPVPAESI